MRSSNRSVPWILVAGSLTLAACGSATSAALTPANAPTSAATLQSYANKTDNLTSFHFSLSEDVSAQGQNLDITARGVEQIASSGPNIDVQINSPAVGGTETTIIYNGTLYIHVPPTQQSASVSSAKWYAVTLPKSGLSGASSFLAGQSADPLQFASLLRETSGKVTKVGTATVLGKSTLEYKGQVNLKKSANQLPSNLTTAIKGAGGILPSVLNFTVWISPNGVIRQLAVPIDTKVGNVDLTMDFFHDGEPVSITPPPSNETAKIPYSQISGQG
ncbi:hypothetical protein SAMN02745225_01151 [Ferrithrix thermotolerans DSM 19514]|jgi:hypothetical protein|uniref:Lipoprotein LprG n=1 Tax=Ferrithrix thermotolerans DSM 19514 TaxID=1121881 RepID=A0A1M4V0K9_9ACTN|nr:hypothetical protein SAMN02745225_01151 [Ferrithrix thermotolerans DSM 19514]